MTEISMVVEPLFLLKPCTIPSSHIDISPSSEIIWVHLHNNQYSNIIVGSFYCPPPPAACTLDELSNFLAAVQQRFPHAKILLGGDFNVPRIDWENCILSESYACAIPYQGETYIFITRLPDGSDGSFSY